MKRRDLLRLIATGARGGGIPWRFVRQGTDHEVWRCGAVQITVPRHREVDEMTSRQIMRRLESELGRDWWRR
jgi:mRNA interferase HicA